MRQAALLAARRVLPADCPALRALRLEALHDTPIGFLQSAAQAAAHVQDEWRHRARRGAEGGESVELLALGGVRPVGTVVGFVPDGRGWLAAGHVTPTHRGGALLERRAYAKLGFVPTGEWQPYEPDPSREELTLVARPP